MFAASASRIASRLQNIQQVRNMTVLSGPPQVKISTGEKLIHALALSAGILAIPGWVLVNIKHYRGL
ncbi:unnamed protein product [Psylliodes chrysocephalus]|uniref:Cytochrome c oxidase subunit VIII n=1 Tax=Psylliodes chrysocephalus TaxID=3402493 RepID=A0A9P0G5X1_9CUCU|nr:unnamed protein product [Psylliodes chrysocephala]